MSGCSVTPNDFPTGSDSRRIQMAVDRASQTGCNYVVIPPCNSRTGTNLWEIDETIELPSHICVEIRGAHLRMCDGVFCQMFRNRNAFLDVGRTPEGMQEDIILRGVGRAVLDGGRHNGLREKMSLKDGLPHIVNNLTVYLHNVRNFRVEGLTIRDQRWYGLCFTFAWEGVIRDLRFEITDRSVRGSETHPWRNQDGVDLRIGCHDIQISDLTGETCDDIVALTALSDPDRPNFETKALCPHLSPDIRNISIRNITGFNNHCALVRLLCHNGLRVHHISIDGLTDATPDDTPLSVPDGVRTACCVKIGENDYYHGAFAKRCVPGELHSIRVSNVFSSALCAVDLNCSVRDLIVRDIFVGSRGRHALAVAKIKFGDYHNLDDPENVTDAEHVLVSGVRYASCEEDAVPFFFDALRAKDFVIRDVSLTRPARLMQLRRPQPGSEDVVFSHVVMPGSPT